MICRSGAGPLKLSLDRKRIDNGPVLHEGHGGVDVLAALRIGRLLQGRCHRVGGERRAALELHVLAQGEGHEVLSGAIVQAVARLGIALPSGVYSRRLS